jgi:lipoprotein-anchoring transpeptidase ErfK/SrfK
MSKRTLLIILAAIVVLVGATVAAIALRWFWGPSVETEPIVTTLPELPANDKQAQAELKKARKALAALEPRGPYIVINTHSNKVIYRTEDSILIDGTCSTGSGAELVDSITGRHWVFNTPLGVFKVNSKLPKPWWRKPDWAYIEEDEKIPSKESERYDPEMMGDYAIGFGDGYFIHGTIYERLLGISVTHGCVRLGSEDIEKLYQKVKIGTMVYIF